MPSLRQYARLIEDCERRALQREAEPEAPAPLFEAAEPEPAEAFAD